MVTRIYTPPVFPYRHAAAGRLKPDSEEPGDNPQQQPQNPTDSSVERLQSQRQQPGQAIQIGTVLQDFNNTLNALGVDEPTRTEVSAYLNIVALQAGKLQPEVSFMRHTLKTAAGVMDKFIAKALDQPSTVVKDWVDALLLQKIDYQGSIKPLSSKPVSLTPTEDHSNRPTITETKPDIKSALQQSKALFLAGKTQQARQLIQQQLAQTDHTSQPDIVGRLHLQQGRFADKLNQRDDAYPHYQKAYAAFQDSGNIKKQAQALYAMATLDDEAGRLDVAKIHYQQVIALDTTGQTNPLTHAHLAKTYNDLGSIHLRQNAPEQAIDSLMKAFHHAGQITGSGKSEASDLPDILSNLGAAQRQSGNIQKSIEAYRLSLKQAKRQGDSATYRAVLETLIETYADAGQPQMAEKAKERLDQFLLGLSPGLV